MKLPGLGELIWITITGFFEDTIRDIRDLISSVRGKAR